MIFNCCVFVIFCGLRLWLAIQVGCNKGLRLRFSVKRYSLGVEFGIDKLENNIEVLDKCGCKYVAHSLSSNVFSVNIHVH